MFSTLAYYICIPFAWIVRTFYSLTGSYGLALILFTLVLKLILLPFQIKSKKSMLRMNRFQPKLKEIQTRYANNKEKMNEEMQRLYAEEGVNPMSGCLWSFLPLPIIMVLYSIIRQPLSRLMMLSTEVVEELHTVAESLGYVATTSTAYEEIGLARFISEHFESFTGYDGLINLDFTFLGLDLTVMPSSMFSQLSLGWAAIGVVLMPFISAALSFLQSKISMANNNTKGDDQMARTNRSMMLMMPLMSLWIGFTLPAALCVYWIANSVLQIVQDFFLNKVFLKKMEEEENRREEERRADRLRRQELARQNAQLQKEKAEKMSLKEKQRAAQAAKAAKAEKAGRATSEAGRIGDRPYARGRSYDPEHYGK